MFIDIAVVCINFATVLVSNCECDCLWRELAGAQILRLLRFLLLDQQGNGLISPESGRNHRTKFNKLYGLNVDFSVELGASIPKQNLLNMPKAQN